MKCSYNNNKNQLIFKNKKKMINLKTIKIL